MSFDRTTFAAFAFLLLLVFAACGAPTVRTLRHQPTMAAESAEEFAQVAIIDNDPERAHLLLWEQGKSRLSVDEIAQALERMHPEARPTTIQSIEYEPVFGQPAMNIFLRGTGISDGDDAYYRFLMMGTEESGYRVADFMRGSGPYPPSSIRKPIR